MVINNVLEYNGVIIETIDWTQTVSKLSFHVWQLLPSCRNTIPSLHHPLSTPSSLNTIPFQHSPLSTPSFRTSATSNGESALETLKKCLFLYYTHSDVFNWIFFATGNTLLCGWRFEHTKHHYACSTLKGTKFHKNFKEILLCYR